MTGTIRTLRVDKGFGFIKDEAGKEYSLSPERRFRGADRRSSRGRRCGVRGGPGAEGPSRRKRAPHVYVNGPSHGGVRVLVSSASAATLLGTATSCFDAQASELLHTGHRW